MGPSHGAGLPVFSAHAEVVPLCTRPGPPPYGILRACGGSSGAIGKSINGGSYSPRMRR